MRDKTVRKREEEGLVSGPLMNEQAKIEQTQRLLEGDRVCVFDGFGVRDMPSPETSHPPRGFFICVLPR